MRQKAFIKGKGILVFLIALAVSLPAQNSKIEFDLFGLNCFPFQEVSRYSYNFNAYGDSWDSYQNISFAKSSPHFGFGAGLTYWIRDSFGFRFQALSWKTQQTSFDNLVSIRYSYYPWYPYFSEEPVEVSYDFKGKVPPELDYRTTAFSLSAVWRTKIGPVHLEASGGLTAYQIGGELRNLDLVRTIPASHGTFLSREVILGNRFDFMCFGGNLGVDLSVPLGGDFEGFLGLGYLFRSAKEPEMFVQTMDHVSGLETSVVIPGIDEIKDHIRYGPLKISTSYLTLNFGLRYRKPLETSAAGTGGKFRFMLVYGVSRMNPELTYERTVSVSDTGSRMLSQNIDLFNNRLVSSYGLGGGVNLSRHWALEVSYGHQPEDLDVDSGPVVFSGDQDYTRIIKYQRPQARIKLDEYGLSLVRYFPIPGAEIFASAGVNLARLSLSQGDLYFLYWKNSGTSDFVSFSGLYSTTGASWTCGGKADLGIQFPIIGPLEGRLVGGYSFYPRARIPLVVDTVTLDEETWGWGELTDLSPSELKQTPTELLLNPSRFRLTFVLAIHF